MANATPHNALNWFEIPVRDIDRAQTFYEALLAAPMRRDTMGPQTMALFHYEEPGVGGCLVADGGASQPADHGPLVYLNAAPSLDAALERAKSAGGRIATPRTELPGDMGCFALVIDTEGNRIGLHALA
jgi:predicted enzyme related to lactoylglutathione lyase